MSTPRRPLFRKIALDRLSSPEQLDQLMTVTRPLGWLALLGIGLFLGGAVLWAVFGAIPFTVAGQGVLIRQHGLFEVVAVGSGQLTELLVTPGQRVDKGQVLARIRRPELRDQLRDAEARLLDRQEVKTDVEPVETENLAIQMTLMDADDRFLAQQIQDLEAQVGIVSQVVKATQKLLKEGLITESIYLQARQNATAVQSKLQEARHAMELNRSKRLELQSGHHLTLLTREQAINAARLLVKQLTNQIQETELIASPFAGSVAELKVNQGDVVSPGRAIASVDMLDSPLIALIYVDPLDGKKIEAGMPIQIEPSIAEREEFGFMLGKVSSVSDYPSSETSMMTLLENHNLVALFSTKGPPFAVYVALEKDPVSKNGYKWSTRRGGELRVTTGTFCQAEVVVRQEAPIRLVIPALKKGLGF